MEGFLPNSCSGVTAERTLVKPSIKDRTVPGERGHRLLRQMWFITNLLCRVTRCSKVFDRVCLDVCSQMPASGVPCVCTRCDGLSVILRVFSQGRVFLCVFSGMCTWMC